MEYSHLNGGLPFYLHPTYYILSMRRRDLENKAEILVCEIHPESTKKIAVIVFYRPPDSDLNYIKEFKKTLQLIRSQNKFDQLIVCGDFNLPNIDWNTGVTTNNNIINQHFTIKQLRIIICGS